MSGINNPSFGANPAASVGLTAVNGVATTFMRSDAAPPYDPNAAFAFAGLGATTISAAASGAVPLTISGYSLTGSQAQSMVSWAGTLNTSGNPDVVKLAFTNTALGSTASLFSIYAGSAGTTQSFRVNADATMAIGGLQLGAGNGLEYFNTLAGAMARTISQRNVRFSPQGAYVSGSNSFIGWTSVATGSGSDAANIPDTIIGRGGAAATLQLGAADAAASVAQTTQVQSVVAGTTDTAGTDWTRRAALGTGTAAGGNIVEKTGFSAKSTGTSQNTAVDREITVAKGKVLTSGAAFSIADIALPTLTMCGGSIEATIVCTDGTDMQSFTQTVTYSAVNKGAAYTTSITASTGDKSVSAGTLTTSWTIVSGTNKVTIKVTPTTSLTPSTNAFLLYYRIKNNSEQATTVL